MAKELAIVLNNGSVNSAVTTALAAQRAAKKSELLRAGLRLLAQRRAEPADHLPVAATRVGDRAIGRPIGLQQRGIDFFDE